MHLGKGDSYTGYDGDLGWIKSAGEQAQRVSYARAMRREDFDQATLEDPIMFAGRMKQIFSELRVERKEPLDGHDAYVVGGRKQANDGAIAVVKLYFDDQSGMLTRLIYYGESPFGNVPIFQYDYSDYREIGGVKIPFRWTLNNGTRPAPENHYSYQVDEIQENIPIEDSKFVNPAPVPTGAK